MHLGHRRHTQCIAQAHKGSDACLWPENSDGEPGVHLGTGATHSASLTHTKGQTFVCGLRV